jgi:hypothetical protein
MDGSQDKRGMMSSGVNVRK